MKMKYIIVMDGHIEVPYLFPEYVTHSVIANAVTRRELEKVISAGFCDYFVTDEDCEYTFACFGQSTSLGLVSRSTEDRAIMNRMFSVNN